MTQISTGAIPEIKRKAVKKALQSAFNTTIVDTIELLTGGLSSALVYKITVCDRSYVLRVIMRPDAFHDPVRQYVCMNLAADAGIAPRVYYTNAEDAISITDFIETKPLMGHVALDDILLELVRVIHSIHTVPNFPPLVNYLDGIDGFIENFKASKLLPDQATEEHFRYYSQIQKAYPRYALDLVPSHNDLNPRNLLFDGHKIWVVDWEAAFQNDRYVDLAIVANNFVKTEDQEEIYLKAYFGDSLDDYKRARFFLMQQVCLMFYAMGMMRFATVLKSQGTVIDECMETVRHRDFTRQIADSTVSINSAEGQFLYGKVLLNEALHNMKTPRFVESIHRMSA